MLTLAIPKKKRIYATAFSPDGRELAAVCGDHTVRVWDTIPGELRRTANGIEETSCGYDLVYLNDGRILFAGIELRVWDVVADSWATVVVGTRPGRQLALSPDGRYLAEGDVTNSTDWGGTELVFYDTADWKFLPAPPDRDNTSGGLAFSADGKFLASSHIVRVGEKRRSLGAEWGHYTTNDYDYVVHIREVPSGRIVRTIPGWQQGARFLAFSPDGSVLAGTAGPRLRAWALATDPERALHKRGTKHFQGLSFTSDGRYLATVSNDETVRVWDALAWREVTTFTWEIGRLLNVTFAPDGLRAAAGSDKGQIVIWDLE